MKTVITSCLCCGRHLAHSHFKRGHLTCLTCITLPVNDAVITARATAEREFNDAQALALSNNRTIRAGSKREAKRAELLTRYAAAGKRCACCHDHKAPDRFDKCAPRTDGLQPNCRECNAARVAFIKAGGALSAWNEAVAQIRALNDAKNKVSSA